MDENLEQAKALMRVVIDESETVVKYTEILQALTDENAKAQLREIISDELNHIERATLEYARLSGIGIAEE